MNEMVTLPRITYTSVPDDVEPVHAWFDANLPVFRQQLGKPWPNRIAGVDDRDGDEYRAASPLDSQIELGRYVEASQAAIERAIVAAQSAFTAWGRTDWRKRVAALRQFARELDRNKHELALAVMYEVGKNRLEALGETEEAVALVEYYCDEMEKRNGFAESIWEGNGERAQTLLRPIGVFAIIAPFNYPVALSVNMMTAALVAGNAVVFKPSPKAGLTAGMLARVVEACDLPRGAFNLVCGTHAGQRLAASRGIDGIAFTGSHTVGMTLIRAMADGEYMRPVLAEMGGKNAAYVSASADLDAAVEGVARSAFNMQGQKCTACSVAFVHASIYDAFIDRLLARAAKVKTGDTTRRDTSNGPLINSRALERYQSAVTHARSRGRVVFGGERLSGSIFDRGSYVSPAIVVDLPRDDRLFHDELFAPLVAVTRFDNLGEAIARGNAVKYGLTSGFYGRDPQEIALYLDTVETGVQYVNRKTGATTGAWPGIQSFCGWKGSGLTGKGGLGPHYLPQFMREQSRTQRLA
jgi:1-pyrroline-5-carboxylate dehydrogenase